MGRVVALDGMILQSGAASYKAALDEMLRRFTVENPDLCRGRGPYAWLGETFTAAAAVRVPLFRMRSLPPPFWCAAANEVQQ